MEGFAEIKDFPGYYANKKGEIYSSYRNGRILKQGKDKAGYFLVLLRKDGKSHTRKVHRLVAETFLEKIGPCVNHKDGIKTNNNLENLEWCSYKENSQHSAKNNLMKKVTRSVYRIENGNVTQKYESVREASRATGVAEQTICWHCRGKSVTQLWKYCEDNENKINTRDYKDIPCFSNYMVNKKGEIYSKKAKRLLKPCLTSIGLVVSMWSDNKKQKNMSVKKIVIITFLGGYTKEIVHKNGDVYDCSLSNLKIAKRGHNIPKKPVEQYDITTGKTINRYSSIIKASKKTRTNASYISSVCKGQRKKAKGWGWRYCN